MRSVPWNIGWHALIGRQETYRDPKECFAEGACDESSTCSVVTERDVSQSGNGPGRGA